jgi:lipoprotein signal peptidase
VTRNHRTVLGLVTGLIVLAADQGSKYVVLDVIDLPERGSVVLLPVLNLTFTWNRGITFGLFNGANGGGTLASALLAAVALAVVAALAVWLRRAENVVVAAALGGVAGGAVGNVVDRLRYGAVADFIDAHAFGWSWYIFNVADAAIVCGVAALVLDGLRGRRGGGVAADPYRR